MATLDSLQFEMQRRVIFFKPTTTMPDDTQLGYNSDPNLIVSPSTPGEQLIYNCPNGTRYLNTDASGNTITEWTKKAQPNGWVPLGGDASLNIFGTESSTWQLNISNDGVILEDSSSNLVIRNYDGSLGNLIIGGLTIGYETGYLRAIDGSVYIDSSIFGLLAATAILEGNGSRNEFVIEHNINSLNHTIVVYDPSDNLIYPHILIGQNTDIIYFHTAPPIGIDYRAVIMGF